MLLVVLVLLGLRALQDQPLLLPSGKCIEGDQVNQCYPQQRGVKQQGTACPDKNVRDIKRMPEQTKRTCCHNTPYVITKREIE